MSSSRPTASPARSSQKQSEKAQLCGTRERMVAAGGESFKSQSVVMSSRTVSSSGQVIQSATGLPKSGAAVDNRRAQGVYSSDSQFSSKSASSSAEGVHTDAAPRVTSARGNAHNRQQFFQRSARVSSQHDHSEGTEMAERGATEKSTLSQVVSFAKKNEVEEDIWMDVDSPSSEPASRAGQTANQESRIATGSSLQMRKQAALYTARAKEEFSEKSLYYDAQDKVEEMEQFQTPPSTPVEAFSHKRRVMRQVEKSARVQSSSSFSSSAVESSSSSHISSSTSTAAASKNLKQVTVVRDKSREATGSTSSSTMEYQDAMSEFQMEETSVRQQFSDCPDIQQLPADSGISPAGSPGSSTVSAITMGLYQRRKMRRQVLRLQSLEEVKMSRFSSESSDVGAIIPEDVEVDILSAFPTVSIP